MAIDATYTTYMNKALPGMFDSSTRNIDGSCVVKEGATVLCGDPVVVTGVTDRGERIVEKATGSNGTPYGVAVRSQVKAQDVNGDLGYLGGDVISVMTYGRIWMRNTETPGFGTAVMTAFTSRGMATEWNGVKLLKVQVKQQ